MEIYHIMTEKKMKSSKVKTVVVECKMKDSLDVKEFEIDPEIFDDVLLEAVTRFAEQRVRNKNAKIAPILTAFDKKDSKDYDKHICYNSYFAIINSGFHRKAEIMRRNFMTVSGIDLQKDPIKSQNAKSDNS